MPAAQPLDLVPPDLHIQLAHAKEVRERADFILRRQHDGDSTDRRGEAEHLPLPKPLAEVEAAIAVDAGPRHGFVK